MPAIDLGDLQLDAVTCAPGVDGQTPPDYLVTITNASPRVVRDFEVTVVAIIDQIRPTDPSVTAQVNKIDTGKCLGVQLRLPVEAIAIRDSNDAELDSAASVIIGESGTPGTLETVNGLTLDFGAAIQGYGAIDTPNAASTPFTINGRIAGNSLVEPIMLTGYLNGIGTLDNVSITGTDAFGFSAATVNRGSVIYDGALEVEIGGTNVGTFD